MKYVELVYAVFGVLAGALMLSVFFGKIKLNKPLTSGQKWLFGLGGAFVLVWGIISLVKAIKPML